MSGFTTEDERLEKFRLKSMSTQKTAGTAIVPPSVTDYGLDPGFRLESSLLEARQNRQVYTGLADDFSKSALNEELLGNYPESRYMWQQAAAMNRKARQYGEIASGYGMTMPTATGTAPQPTVTGTAPQPLQPAASAEALAEEPGESVPELMDYDSAVSSAQEAYEAYRKAQKEFDREYTWRRDPESASGYDYDYATLQERKQAYLESVDYLLDHHDSFQTDVGLAPRTNGTAADREMLQMQLDQMTREMWDYYNAAPENADPAAIAWYIEEIAAKKAAMASLPEAAVGEEALLQMLGGNYYTGDPTLGGTAGTMALGALGLDTAADLRDISYDIQNWKDVSTFQKVTDFAALLPLVGGIKYVDDAAGAVKAMGKAAGAAEEAADAAKAAEVLTDAAKAQRYQDLMDAVAAQADDAAKQVLDPIKGSRYNGPKLPNKDVREWYVSNVSAIRDSIDESLPLEERAHIAFDARNRLRTAARQMMADTNARDSLNKTRPNKTFEELLEHKIKDKGMTEEEALLDIYRTATKTNADVNSIFGIGG